MMLYGREMLFDSFQKFRRTAANEEDQQGGTVFPSYAGLPWRVSRCLIPMRMTSGVDVQETTQRVP